MIDDGWDRPGFASTKKGGGSPAPPRSHTLHSSLKASNIPTPKNDEDRESKVKGSVFRKRPTLFTVVLFGTNLLSRQREE